MQTTPILLASLFMLTALSGCFGGDDEDAFDYVPGADFKPTGKTVALTVTVSDVMAKEVYPGLDANFWAFCVRPTDPDDDYSAAAIEYRDEGSTCSVPGPTIRVQQGDRIEVRFVNDHFHPHTIHWHGQHVPMEADGVPGVTQDSVNMGSSFEYDFIAKRAGTLWYHCHVDGQFHVMMGLFGAIIVEPQDTRWEPKDIDREYTLIFHTARREHIQYKSDDPHAGHGTHGMCGASGVQNCQNPAVDVTPDVFMLNGVSHPNTMERDDTLIRLGADERIRLRLINTGETVETFHTHGHDMLVTHKDGNPLPPAARYYSDTLSIGPAERYDVVLSGDRDAIGAWVAHTHVEGHITNDRQHPGGMHTMIVYDEWDGDLHAYKAERAGGLAYRAPREIPTDHHFQESIAFGPLEDPTGNMRAINRSLTELPVPEDLCLVDSVQYMARLEATAANRLLTNLDLRIAHAELDKDIVLRLDAANRTATWAPAFEDLVAGNHTVRLVGETAEATVHVTQLIDHFETEATAKERGRPC